MFLQPSEVGFLKHLKEARVPVVEFEFPAKRIVNVQSQLEKLIGQNYYLNRVSVFTWSFHGQLLLTYVAAVSKRRISILSPSVRLAQSAIHL